MELIVYSAIGIWSVMRAMQTGLRRYWGLAAVLILLPWVPLGDPWATWFIGGVASVAVFWPVAPTLR